MKITLIGLLVIALGILFSGCLSITARQVEGKLPKIDAAELAVEVSTIYGANGTLVEKGVRWTGNVKTIESSELRITSPAGTYKRTIKGAVITTSVPAAAAPNESK